MAGLGVGCILNTFYQSQLHQMDPVNTVEMFKLPGWGWLLLLSAVILIVWLLILFQVNSYHAPDNSQEIHPAYEDQFEMRGDEEG